MNHSTPKISKRIGTKVWTCVAAVTVTALLGVAGGAGTASAADDPVPPARERPVRERPDGERPALACERLDEINARLAEVVEHLTSRQDKLDARRAEAVAAGRDRVVERIDRASTRSTERAAKVHDRIERLAAWSAEHCPAT
jgi:hypothetical protein